MITTVKAFLKRVLPERWILTYHRFLSLLAATVYGNPSRKMIVIGVTGTKGKTTVSNILWKLLTDAGHTVGLTGTLNYRIGRESTLSNYKMTMLGRFQLQRWLRRMVAGGCDIAIVETTSEGIKQFRHVGVQYDVCVFTNLSPEHIESHGGFENYKQAKLELFRHLERSGKKVIGGQTIPKISVVNHDDAHAGEFEAIGRWKKVRVGMQNADVVYDHVMDIELGTAFTLNKENVTSIPLFGTWNVTNAAMAAGTAYALGVPLDQIAKSLPSVDPVPGRMEFIDEGQPFTVIVDYAHEPKGLELLYAFWRARVGEKQKMITLISSTGGGRDVARRPKNGAVAAKYCNQVIVTNEDPYDDDPQQIIDEVTAGAVEAGKKEGENLWRIMDRREAIAKAFSLAGPGDVVFLVAKGAEQSMVVAGGRKIPWDDRAVAREELRKLK